MSGSMNWGENTFSTFGAFLWEQCATFSKKLVFRFRIEVRQLIMGYLGVGWLQKVK